MKTQLETVTEHYLICALWSSTDNEGEPLDARFSTSDLSDCALTKARNDVKDFLAYCAENGADPFNKQTAEQVGHDLWLTRNGHGAGFWDRGLGAHGQAMADHAKTLGSCDLYEGEDGKFYIS